MHKKNIIKLLGLQDKNINLDNFEINSIDNTLNIYISKKIVSCSCPSCKHETKRIHDHRIQKIKHKPINGFKTSLFLKKTRLLCTHCGKKFYMNYNDIVNPRFRCSNELFNSIINDLQSSMTFDEIAKRNFVSTGVVVRYLLFFAYLMDWKIPNTLPKHIGIDEFKGNCNGSKYLFHVYNLDTKETIIFLKTRKYEDIVGFFNSIKNRNDVEIVTMDLYLPFKKAVKDKLKFANIVADRFHYTKIVASSLDKLRISLWHNATGDLKKYLKNTKLALLKDINNVKEDKLLEHEEKLNYLFELNPKIKYGYQLYQSFLRIKDASSYDEACKLFSDWLQDAQTCTIKEFKSAAETLLKWNKEILNSFKFKYSNGATEGKNNKIKRCKRNAYGFRNLLNFLFRVKIQDCNI